MEARLYCWKFLATIKLEDAMFYTLNENINNILNSIWAFCWFLVFLWKTVACCESQNPLWPEGTEMISMFNILMTTSSILQVHCRVISLWQQILKTPNLFCMSLSPSMCNRFEAFWQQWTDCTHNTLWMHRNGYMAFGSKSAHIWPSQKKTSMLTAKGQVKSCKTKEKHAEKNYIFKCNHF